MACRRRSHRTSWETLGGKSHRFSSSSNLWILFHLPPAGSHVALIEKLAELIKTPHPDRPALVITLIQSLSCGLLPSFFSLSPTFLHFELLVLGAERQNRGGVHFRVILVETSSLRFLLFIAEKTDDLLLQRDY